MNADMIKQIEEFRSQIKEHSKGDRMLITCPVCSDAVNNCCRGYHDLLKEITPISVSERMPESGSRIAIFWINDLGKRRTSFGWWLQKMKHEACDEELESDCDYDEEKDCYYVPEGWYEWGWETDFRALIKSERVTHWLPLPSSWIVN